MLGDRLSTRFLTNAKKYIRDQERADILQDKMSVKEYEDPFGAKPGKDPQERT
jgi:putative transposase